jgi:hypothetical protein
MSPDEQNIEIGRLVTERGAALRKSAILLGKIRDRATIFDVVARQILTVPQSNKLLKIALGTLDNLKTFGSIDDLQKSIVEYLDIDARISEINKRLDPYGLACDGLYCAKGCDEA